MTAETALTAPFNFNNTRALTHTRQHEKILVRTCQNRQQPTRICRQSFTYERHTANWQLVGRLAIIDKQCVRKGTRTPWWPAELSISGYVNVSERQGIEVWRRSKAVRQLHPIVCGKRNGFAIFTHTRMLPAVHNEWAGKVSEKFGRKILKL